MIDKVIEYLNEGKNLSLISDAGRHHFYSGRILIKICNENTLKVIPIQEPPPLHQ